MPLIVVVSYYPGAVAIADAHAESFVRNAVKTYTDIGHPILNLASSTINVIEAARCLRKEGVIPELFIDWNGRSYEVNGDGRWQPPADFPDYASVWAERLLGGSTPPTSPAPAPPALSRPEDLQRFVIDVPPDFAELQVAWAKVPEKVRGTFLLCAKYATAEDPPANTPRFDPSALVTLVECGLLTAFPVSSDPDDTRMNLGLSELGEQLYNLRILITPLKES